MTKSSPVIDISSDEDGFFGNEKWRGRNQNDDESDDDVVVVSEVFTNPKRSERFVVNNAADGSDSDCVILDSEPVGSVTVENSGADDADDDTVDVKIVSEKGQVACRDFPHSRHHCAKFPFDVTPHQVHCHQCHCYVCDSIAPCRYWGTGQCNYDHCNASEKYVEWKMARKSKLLQNRGSVLPNITPERIIKSGGSARDPRLNPSMQSKAKYPDRTTGGSQVISPPALKRPGIVGDSVTSNKKKGSSNSFL